MGGYCEAAQVKLHNANVWVQATALNFKEAHPDATRRAGYAFNTLALTAFVLSLIVLNTNWLPSNLFQNSLGAMGTAAGTGVYLLSVVLDYFKGEEGEVRHVATNLKADALAASKAKGKGQQVEASV